MYEFLPGGEIDGLQRGKQLLSRHKSLCPSHRVPRRPDMKSNKSRMPCRHPAVTWLGRIAMCSSCGASWGSRGAAIAAAEAAMAAGEVSRLMRRAATMTSAMTWATVRIDRLMGGGSPMKRQKQEALLIEEKMDMIMLDMIKATGGTPNKKARALAPKEVVVKTVKKYKAPDLSAPIKLSRPGML